MPDSSPEPRHLPDRHPAVRHGRIGVLLLNLGTPDATDYWSMRRYLKEFLSDRRVIEVPRWKWWPILNGIILTVRPGRKGKDYAKIWNNERNEGPLKTITRSQAEKLARLLGDERIVVDWAMRYANPTTAERLAYLQAQGCDRILLVPLYPQYAAATTATACDHAFRALMQMRWQPAVRVAPAYYEDPAYIEAIAGSVRDHLATLDFQPDTIIASFHGMPQSVSGGRRSLSLPVPEDLAAGAREARLAERALAYNLPVAVRQRSLAAALHHRHGGAAGEVRHQAPG